VDEALLPESVAVAEVAAPACGFTVTVTTVPTGMFVAATTTVTELAVPAGKTMSGSAKEPAGEAGAAPPATEVIARLGPLGNVTEVGAA
jgi:hypothetical protein